MRKVAIIKPYIIFLVILLYFILIGRLSAERKPVHIAENELNEKYKDFSPEQDLEWIRLNIEVKKAYREGRYEKGIGYAQRVYEYALKAFGKEHPDTLTSMHNLAFLYKFQGRYEEAEPLYKEALQLTEKVLGKEHPDTLISMNNLAALYRSQGRYVEAEPLNKEALQLMEKVLGKEHLNTLSSMNNLAGLYVSQGRYGEAEPLYKEALQLMEKVLGKEHPSTLNSMNDLATLYVSQGRYEEAEPLYKEALQRKEKVLGKEHPDTLNSMNSLALLYESQGRYGEAEPLYKEALKLTEKVLGKEHPRILTYMNNLAALYESQGRYGEAESLYKEVLQLREKVLGKEHPDTSKSMNNLAALYRSQDRYGEAEPLYKEALQIMEKVLGKEHPDTLTSMHNLAALYQSQGRYEEAEPLCKEALQLTEKVLGMEHPDTLTSMHNLAFLYKFQGRYEEAESLYKEVLQLKEKILGKEHPDTLTSMNNLAELYQSQERYVEAEPLYKEALQLTEKVLGKEHPDTLTTQMNYIALLIVIERIQSSFRRLKKLENSLLSRSFQELYSISTERVKRIYLAQISDFQDVVFSFALKYPKEEHRHYAASVILRWKQVYAEEQAFQHHLLHITDAPEIQRLKNRIRGLRRELSASLNHKQGTKDITSVFNELIAEEKALSEKARAFKAGLNVSNASIDKLMGRLPPNSALIEFCMYRPFDFETGKYDKHHWAAYLLLSDVEEKQQLFFEDIGVAEDILGSIKDPNFLSTTFYQELLGKFDQEIKNKKICYIATDGILEFFPLEGLKLSDGRYLVERQQINRLQTGRDLFSTTQKNPSTTLLAFGGIDYGKGSDIPAEIKVLLEALSSNIRAARDLKAFAYLKHSREEAEIIARLFELNYKGGKAVIYTDTNAHESVLKQIKEPPKILHLSTHGFYLESEKEKEMEERITETPLLTSGLAMAGANQGIDGNLDENGDDGLLYSIEVLGINLVGTELVSLSACSTVRGVIDYSEGIYSLVRAFRTAGAQSVLMTLWSINDKPSKDFMTAFYKNWFSSKDGTRPSDALHKTRLEFIHHSDPKYRDPDVWAPYVLIGR